MTSSAKRVSVTLASSRMQLRVRGTNPKDDIIASTRHASSRWHVPEPPVSSVLLHNQDLVDVMFELEPFQADNRAALAFNMALGGLVHPLHENELKPLRKEKDGTYGPRQWDIPFLSEKLPFTFSSLPRPANIQRVLQNDIGGGNYFRFTALRDTPEENAAAIIDLLGNITNPRFASQGAIVQMASPTINYAKHWMPNWENDFTLNQSDVQVTVAPRGQIFELEYHEHYFSTTLLTGSKVLFVFPPHSTNIGHLRSIFQGKLTRLPSLGILLEMQHGIAVIQKRGQTLLIPPFWPVMTFCTETCVSAGFFVAAASAFMSRIRNTNLWLTECLFWPTLAQRQTQLVPYVQELAQHLSAILAVDAKQPKMAKSVQQAICSEWVKVSAEYEGEKDGNMEEKVGGLLGCIEDEGTRRRIAVVFTEAWVSFCELKRRKSGRCRLCGVRVVVLPGDDEDMPNEKLARHVRGVHCDFDLS